jgi:hypothetical protein
MTHPFEHILSSLLVLWFKGHRIANRAPEQIAIRSTRRAGRAAPGINDGATD